MFEDPWPYLSQNALVELNLIGGVIFEKFRVKKTWRDSNSVPVLLEGFTSDVADEEEEVIVPWSSIIYIEPIWPKKGVSRE